ncbi:unnamed protein product [Hydatigera taeniaeformis]|uniref:Uncharacterized protein n=1 Tax=Hydatigena taeniaeformis TaxID=6205 RepID=A0A0R3XCY3_HYDTA|nr:unnamed protein product [Hydatigera taeniaeformis]
MLEEFVVATLDAVLPFLFLSLSLLFLLLLRLLSLRFKVWWRWMAVVCRGCMLSKCLHCNGGCEGDQFVCKESGVMAASRFTGVCSVGWWRVQSSLSVLATSHDLPAGIVEVGHQLSLVVLSRGVYGEKAMVVGTFDRFRLDEGGGSHHTSSSCLVDRIWRGLTIGAGSAVLKEGEVAVMSVSAS